MLLLPPTFHSAHRPGRITRRELTKSLLMVNTHKPTSEHIEVHMESEVITQAVSERYAKAVTNGEEMCCPTGYNHDQTVHRGD